MKTDILKPSEIQNLIFTFRGVQVMTDRDLADMYQVETRVLNQAVKRNIERFPLAFRFQLSGDEFEYWRSQIVMSNEDKMGLRRPPFVFTEQVVAMLSAVLKSKTAIQVSIKIMDAFTEMRKFISINGSVFQRLTNIELKLFETDQKFDKIFKALENTDTIPKQGVFFDGQIFDAHKFVSDIVRSAKQSIVIIDNYIDDTVLTLLSKKSEIVNCLILTKTISKQLKLDADKFNIQYGKLTVKEFDKSHDRFLIIDNETVFHFGAPLKDFGKKWFAFSKMDKDSITIIHSINELNKP
ncbi:hypothetical protein MASR2M47_44330 [Draconibacterium sp.]